MIRLEKITLQGFKSFKRPTTIIFPSNFVVITGPNGCGKSNIGDSIAFVLGRASSKYLRAKKAQDLIFHGSKTKPPSDFAKVNLVFSNKDKILPVDEENILVTRTLNKEGISSYRLNGKLTTRQQILDLFIQARLNPGGHNIIRQGDVSKIIDMNPLERRGIIDEIAGITEYDEKREQALRELEKVEEKIREAEIILEQKEQIVNKLQRERDAALEYKRLQNELELVKATIIWKEFSSSEKNLGNIGKEIEENEREMETLNEELKKIDEEIDKKNKEFDNLMQEAMKKEEIEIAKKVSKIEASIEMKENLIASNEREIQRLSEVMKSLSLIGRAVELKPILEMKGVHGFVKDLIQIPEKYRIAADVAAGQHMHDIVVDTLDTAIACIKYLKEKRIGRARFLPLDRLHPQPKQNLPEGTIGWLSDLVHHERQYTSVAEYVFGGTACVYDIEKAKKIAEKHRIRMVTLEGDLFEQTGAIFGGHYSKKPEGQIETKKYEEEKRKLEEENKILRLEIEELEKELGELNKKLKDTKTFNFEARRNRIKEELAKLSEKRREIYDRKMNLQEELNRLKINRARYEANFDNLRLQWEEIKKKWEELDDKEKEIYQKKGLQTLKDMEKEILAKISSIGPVNMRAIEEFEILHEEFEEFKERVERIAKEKDSIIRTIGEIENKKREVFMKTLNDMSRIFKEIYKELTGGEAELCLEVKDDINSGLLISAQPPGKKLLYIDAMSGGEKALTALAFLFTIQRYKPSPFYVLDEVDAALDKPNTRCIINMIKKHSRDVQFIIISHNDDMVKAADIVYGVSMEEGESKVLGIKLPEENN
jgi:chromosome segregation protein